MTAYITNAVQQDGFGARLHRAMQVMAVTFYLRDTYQLDLQYIHAPFDYEDANCNYYSGEVERGEKAINPYNEYKRDSYMERGRLWNKRVFVKGITLNDININDFILSDKSQLWEDVITKNIDGKLYAFGEVYHEFDCGMFSSTLHDTYYEEIRERLDITTPPTDKYSVNIHIRRKDSFGGRWLSDDYYIDILNALIPYKDRYDITICTQREGFDPAKYEGWNIAYDDQEEDFDRFVKMMYADVLVLGISSYSVAAGFLNRNIVVSYAKSNRLLDRWFTKDEYIKSL